MALKRIDVQLETTGDLPFLNKLGDGFEALVGTNWFIRETIVCDSGYLVLTAKFKAFLFKDSAMYGFLSEALNVWCSSNDLSYPLFAEVLRTKKITLAVDDEAFSSLWTTSGNKYIQSQSPLERDGQEPQVSNPLLPPTNVVSTSRKRKQTSSTASTEQIGH